MVGVSTSARRHRQRSAPLLHCWWSATRGSLRYHQRRGSKRGAVDVPPQDGCVHDGSNGYAPIQLQSRDPVQHPTNGTEWSVDDDALFYMRFAAALSAPAGSRRLVEGRLQHELPSATVSDAILLTSELVTNAIIHTLGPGELYGFLNAHRRSLRVEVRDVSSSMPAVRLNEPSTRPGGLGLRLVNEIATRWGAVPSATGKTVWFELDW